QAFDHLDPAAQMCGGRGGQPRVEVVEGAGGAGGRQDVGEVGVVGAGVVNIVRGDDRQAECVRQRHQDVVAGVVAGLVEVGDLDEHVGVAEHVDESSQGRLCRALASVVERLPHPTLAASGEDRPVVVVRGGELVRVVDGSALVPPHVGGGERGGQARVSLGVAGEDQQV